jgi:type I restriction enzyme, S subunit
MSKKPSKTLEKKLEESLTPEDGMPYEVPDNWIWIKLKSINSNVSRGIQPNKFSDEIFELYSVPSFELTEPEYIAGKDIGSNKQLVKQDEVLLCKINPRINRVWLVGEQLNYRQLASTEWIAVSESKMVFPKYLLYLLRSPYFRKLLTSNVSGVGGSLTRARPKDVENYPIALPPYNEQVRIVEKIEFLLNKIDDAKQLIDDAKKTFELRQASILEKVFRGELTANWRKYTKEIESAETLLDKIAQRRKENYRLIWEEANQKGERKPRQTLLNKVPKIDEKPRVPLPESWVLINIDFLGHVTKLAGFEYTKYFQLEDTGDIPVIRAQNVQMGRFVESNIKFISKDVSDTLERSQLHGKEVLMVFIGAGTGNVCMTPPEGRWHLAPNVAKITVDGILPEYLNYYLQSPLGQGYIKSKMKATAQQSLSMGTIREVLVHLPPLEEQYEIVGLIKELTKFLEEEQQVLMDINIENIKQAILAKAFRGELGTNDPREESAVELLKIALQE